MMTDNPYKPPQIHSDVGHLAKPRTVGLFSRIVAVMCWVVGGIIAGLSLWVLVIALMNPESQMIRMIGIYNIVFYTPIIPTLGIGMILFGIDQWQGTKRFTWLAALLISPFIVILGLLILVLSIRVLFTLSGMVTGNS